MQHAIHAANDSKEDTVHSWYVNGPHLFQSKVVHKLSTDESTEQIVDICQVYAYLYVAAVYQHTCNQLCCSVLCKGVGTSWGQLGGMSMPIITEGGGGGGGQKKKIKSALVVCNKYCKHSSPAIAMFNSL